MASRSSSPVSGLPPLVTQAEAASWINLDRSRLSQIKSNDPTFPAPLPEQLLRAIVGNTRVSNVWSRDALVHWAQTTGPIRYSDDRPIPLFPITQSPLAGKDWEPITSGQVELDGGIPCGWLALHCERSLLVHAYGPPGLRRVLIGESFGTGQLLSAAALSAIVADVNAAVAVPEFLTIVVSIPDGESGTVVAATASVFDATVGTASELASPWIIGRTLPDAAQVSEVLGYALPWFRDRSAEAVPAWSPTAPVPVAVFDKDALFAHQAHWWLEQNPGHRFGPAITTLAAAAVANVRARHEGDRAPAGWTVPTRVDPPTFDSQEPVSAEVSAAADSLRHATSGDGVSPFLLSYVSTVLGSQVFRIRLTALPTLFAAAARDADGAQGIECVVDDRDGAEVLLMPVSAARRQEVPVIAEVPVAVTLQEAPGTATIRLHADNTLTVSGSSFG